MSLYPTVVCLPICLVFCLMLLVAWQGDSLGPTIFLQVRGRGFHLSWKESHWALYNCPCILASQLAVAIPPTLPNVSCLPLQRFPEILEAKSALGSLRAHACSLACLAGPLRQQVAGCKLQSGVLLAHLCTVAHAADSNSEILIPTPSPCLEGPAVPASSVGKLMLCE